jgi:hypothetical protein
MLGSRFLKIVLKIHRCHSFEVDHSGFLALAELFVQTKWRPVGLEPVHVFVRGSDNKQVLVVGLF